VDFIRQQQAHGHYPMQFPPGAFPDAEPEGQAPGQIVVPRRYRRTIDQIAAQLGRPPKLRDLPEPLRSRVRAALQRGA
jgi:hypothetical protein